MENKDLDNCQVCVGLLGGEPGNENWVAGTRMCDYCHALFLDYYCKNQQEDVKINRDTLVLELRKLWRDILKKRFAATS